MDYQSKEKFVLKTFPNDEFGCEYDGYEHENEQLQEKSHVAFLFKRGGCPYVTKALNARRAGGAMTIVYLDDIKEDARNIIPIAAKNMADNVPPVVVINNDDGEKLKESLENGKNLIRMSVDFDLEKKSDENKKVSIWLSAMNSHSYDFLQDFYKYYKYFLNVIEFDVVFRLKEMGEVVRKDEKSGQNMSASKITADEWKFKNENVDYSVEDVVKSCYSKGKYCALSDANRLSNPIESVDQAIIQTCLWERANGTKGGARDPLKNMLPVFDNLFNGMGSHQLCKKNFIS